MEFNFRYNLFLDDLRDPTQFYPEPLEHWVICRDMDSFVNCITQMGMPSRIAFDNDLGEGEGKDGYDCMKWYVNQFGGILHEVDIHTDNIPAGEQMVSFANSWFKVHGEESSPGCYVNFIPGSRRREILLGRNMNDQINS